MKQKFLLLLTVLLFAFSACKEDYIAHSPFEDTLEGQESLPQDKNQQKNSNDLPPEEILPPLFSIEDNANISYHDTITLTAAEGVEIRYTLNNTTPTKESNLYQEPLTFTLEDCGEKVIQAIAIKEERISSVAKCHFIVKDTQVAAPQFSIKEQNSRLNFSNTIALEAAEGNKIYYTIDGSQPQRTSLVYEEPIQLSVFSSVGVYTIKAIAVEGNNQSEISSLTFILPPESPIISITGSQTPTSHFNINSITAFNITAGEGESIYFTTDGSNPTNESTLFLAGDQQQQNQICQALQNPGSTLFKAVAIKNGASSNITPYYVNVSERPSMRMTVENQSAITPYRRGNIVITTSTPEYYMSINNGESRIYQSGEKINVKSLPENARLKVMAIDYNSMLTSQHTFHVQVDKNLQNPSKNLSCWMDWLDDSLPIQKLNLPGTHESGAVLPISDIIRWSQCQGEGYAMQFSYGIRVLDLRIDKNMNIYHGSVSMEHSLQYAMDEIKKFLNANPSEFLIVSIKDENGAGDQQVWTNNVKRIMESTGCLYTGPQSSYTVGNLRGKFIIVRRFGYFDHGIHPGRWPKGDGSESGLDEIAHGNPLMKIQDRYGYSGFGSTQANDKKNKIDTLLNTAGHTPNDGILYINFISATGINGGTAGPGTVAETINPWFINKLHIKQQEAANGQYYRWGIVMMDFANRFPDLPRLYISTNNFNAYQ